MVTRSAPATRRGKGRSHLREVRYGSFRRWFKPPAHVTSEAISASYDAGVLVKRTPADVLREARRRDSGRKRDHVFRTVDAMKQNGTPITFAAVARTAKVSQWLVHADGVREYIEAARRTQAAEPAEAKRAGRNASEASLQTDLELAKQDNRRLRGEVDRLKRSCGNDLVHDSMRRQLSRSGAESMNSPPLMIATGAKTRLATELDDTRSQLRIAEDDLAATRTSLSLRLNLRLVGLGDHQFAGFGGDLPHFGDRLA